MNCCNNKIIICKNHEKVCVNCGIIHDFQYVNEISSKHRSP